MRKIFFTVLFVLFSAVMYCQNNADRYIDNPSLALKDAQFSFNEGEYEKTIRLVKIYQSLSGKKDGEDVLSKAQQCQQLIEKARLLENQGDYSGVTQCYRSIMGINPNDPNVSHYMNSQAYALSNGQVINIAGIDFVYVSGDNLSGIEDFLIGKYEVTNGQWRKVMGNIPSATKTLDHPVHNVSFQDAQSYIKRLNANYPAYNFRLPTKEEWQWAAHGGINKEAYAYSGSNNYNDVAWMQQNSGVQDGEQYSVDVSHTHAVGNKAPNSLGIYDMSGNVEEIYSDLSGQDHKQIGGSYWSPYYMAYSTIETPDNYINCTDEPHPIVGFRLLIEVDDTQSGLNPRQGSPNTNGRDYVDMGLSVKWATCNVGASSPSDYGDYFAWGEVRPKGSYSWIAYKFRVDGDSYNNVILSKYNTTTELGSVDGKTQLDYSDDAARFNWGGDWRIPTKEEWEELISEENCTWSWLKQGGKNGFRVTSKKTGNSIFLPATGFWEDYDSVTPSNSAGAYGRYWSSTLQSGYSSGAWQLYMYYDYTSFYGNCGRANGQSIRPVIK